MVDKLKFRIRDFQLKKSATFEEFSKRTICGAKNEVQENLQIAGYLEGDQPIYAEKLVINGKNFYATCRPSARVGPGGVVAEYFPVLIIEFNPAMVVKGHNIGNLTESEFIESIKLLKGFIDENFILKNDFFSEPLSRLDIGCDISVKNEVRPYIDALKHLPKTRRMKMRDYGETVLYLNKQRQFTAYDKASSIYAQKSQFRNLVEGNILRLETRSLKKRSQYYETIGDVLTSFDTLPDRIKEVFFSMTSGIKRDAIFYELSEVFEYFKSPEKPGRYWFNDVLKNIGLSFLLQRYSQDTIIAALKNCHADKSLISRVNTSLKQHRYKQELTRRNLSEYLDELTEKIEKLAV